MSFASQSLISFVRFSLYRKDSTPILRREYGISVPMCFYLYVRNFFSFLAYFIEARVSF